MEYCTERFRKAIRSGFNAKKKCFHLPGRVSGQKSNFTCPHTNCFIYLFIYNSYQIKTKNKLIVAFNFICLLSNLQQIVKYIAEVSPKFL